MIVRPGIPKPWALGRKVGVATCVCRSQPPPCPSPAASSIAGGVAACAAGARCRWSSGWPGSSCPQRGSHPSGTVPAGPRSPAWGAVPRPQARPSAPASIGLAEQATAAWRHVGTHPEGLPVVSVTPETKADVPFTHVLLMHCHSHREEEEDGENERKRNQPARKKQKV